jgi:hypothetical protein
MTLIELVVFVGFPACLAFCFVFPFQDGAGRALCVGIDSAIMAALSLAAVGGVWRLFRKRWPDWPAFEPWSCTAFGLVALYGSLVIQDSRFALLGVPAACAAFVGVIGPHSWRKAGWVCFAFSVLGSIALRLFAHLPMNSIPGIIPQIAHLLGGSR